MTQLAAGIHIRSSVVWIESGMRKVSGLDADGEPWSMSTPLTDEESRIVYHDGYDAALAINCHVFADECKHEFAHRSGCMVLMDDGRAYIDVEAGAGVTVTYQYNSTTV